MRITLPIVTRIIIRTVTRTVAAASLIAALQGIAAQTLPSSPRAYLGFDRNDYPGDAALAGLRKSFRYTSYWLNTPPGDQQNTWIGKRSLLRQHGFGFLVLFNGRLDADLKGKDAAALGAADGNAAVAAARKEGFPPHVLIFLDQEEGGRLLPEQAAYLFAWVDAVREGGARAGIYCSGIPVRDGDKTITTAQDIVAKAAARDPGHARPETPALWVANDQCPPSPGCSPGEHDLSPHQSGTGSAVVWQFAQSPRRAQFTTGCAATYAPDGNCYAPGPPHSPATFLDLNTAMSVDPSSGR